MSKTLKASRVIAEQNAKLFRADIETRAKRMIDNNGFINAVKFLRHNLDLGLKEAKDLADALRAGYVTGTGETPPPAGEIKCVGTIDLTPSWSGVLRLLVEAANRGNSDAWSELERMARLADKYVEEHKK